MEFRYKLILVYGLGLLIGWFLFLAPKAHAATPEPALAMMFGNEGGLTKDNGGWTKYGISQRGSGLTEQQIKALDLPAATKWYLTNVWRPLGLDRVSSQIVANEIFDSAVNEGNGTAARRIQQAVNLSNSKAMDVPVDGVLGSATMQAWAHCDMIEFYVNWIVLRGVRYQMLVSKNPGLYQQYFKSWTYRLKNNVRQAVHEYDAYLKEHKK